MKLHFFNEVTWLVCTNMIVICCIQYKCDEIVYMSSINFTKCMNRYCTLAHYKPHKSIIHVSFAFGHRSPWYSQFEIFLLHPTYYTFVFLLPVFGCLSFCLFVSLVHHCLPHQCLNS